VLRDFSIAAPGLQSAIPSPALLLAISIRRGKFSAVADLYDYAKITEELLKIDSENESHGFRPKND
jgi:hypothetical protein